MSVFAEINHSRTSDEVAHQLEALILEGVLCEGDQLPGERELATTMGVSRPIVRQAIEQLEAQDILIRRHGGGTYVGPVIGKVFSPQIAKLLPEHEKAAQDYLEYRREIEAIAARFAAERATTSDREALSDLVARMDAAHADPDFELEAQLDVEFHSLIGEMTHNLILLHTLRSCYEMLAGGVFENRSRLYSSPGARQMIHNQHKAIAGAIINGNGELAAEASAGHMTYIAEQTLRLAENEERERISSLRLLQRGQR